MNILVIGSGGREHALIWKIKQSSLVKNVYCAPGNGGIAALAECVDIAVDDTDKLIAWAKTHSIDLTVVGPEAPLVNGIVDAFEAEGLTIFGPSRKAAQLEGSKIFSKEFMYRCNIPTAIFKTFTDYHRAAEFLLKAEFPLVIKADGLAAGKGVIICKDLAEGQNALKRIMEDKEFKEAGSSVVIEECLAGEEVSILAVSDGENFCLLDTSQDHKRIFDDDLGPNTGGMGAYSPAPIATDKLLEHIATRIIEPTIRGMNREGMPFKGVLYAGLMLTKEGPMVLEYNVRFGDPETQAVLIRLKSDIVELMLAACHQKLNNVVLEWDDRSSVCVVMSSGGYPGEYKNGFEITGLDEAVKYDDAVVFHAGTKKEGDAIVTAGGRVLGVTRLGHGIHDAITRTYEVVEKIKFKKCFFRRDIGAKALAHLNELNRVSR